MIRKIKGIKDFSKRAITTVLTTFLVISFSMILLPKQTICAEATTLPTEYNSNAAKEVAIRDQGSYGTCWVFGSVGALEMTLYHTTGQVYDLSEAYILDTLKQQFKGNKGEINNCGGLSDFSVSSGGDMFDALMAMVSSPYGGIVPEEEAPYDNFTPDSAVIDSLYISPITKQEYSQRVRILEYSLLQNEINTDQNDKAYDQECIQKIKEAIMEYGAVAAGMHQDVSTIDSKGICSDEPLKRMPNHGICIVGWKRIGNEEYWIVKDSHGVEWGDQGYIYMKTSASHMTYISNIYVIRSAKVVKQAQGYNRYQEVDNLRGGIIFSHEGTPVWQMQLFHTTAENEVLDYAYFYTRVSKGTCEVYLDTDQANIEKAGNADYDFSKALKLGTVNLTHGGTYTIPVNDVVLSNKAGQSFLIIIKTVPAETGLINRGSVNGQDDSTYYLNGNLVAGKGLWAPVGCMVKQEASSRLPVELLPELSISTGATEPAKQVVINATATDVSGIKHILYQKGNITSIKKADWKKASVLDDSSMFAVKENGWYSIMATDYFGNSMVQNLYIDNIDTQAPKTPKLTIKTGAKKVSGTGEAGSTAYILYQGVMYHQTVKSDGTFNITVPKLVKGKTLVAFLVDSAGNSSAMTVAKIK